MLPVFQYTPGLGSRGDPGLCRSLPGKIRFNTRPGSEAGATQGLGGVREPHSCFNTRPGSEAGATGSPYWVRAEPGSFNTRPGSEAGATGPGWRECGGQPVSIHARARKPGRLKSDGTVADVVEVSIHARARKPGRPRSGRDDSGQRQFQYTPGLGSRGDTQGQEHVPPAASFNTRPGSEAGATSAAANATCGAVCDPVCANLTTARLKYTDGLSMNRCKPLPHRESSRNAKRWLFSRHSRFAQALTSLDDPFIQMLLLTRSAVRSNLRVYPTRGARCAGPRFRPENKSAANLWRSRTQTIKRL